MSVSARKFIDNCLHSRVPIPQIVQLLLREYGLTVSENTLYHERNKNLYPLFSNGEGNICGTEVDQLLKEFEQKDDVSYIYVLHEKNTGFVTYTLTTHEKSRPNDTSFVYDVAVSEKDMFNWRDQLEVTGTEKILVAFAWCHNDEYRNVQMSPYFLSGDMTFGVN